MRRVVVVVAASLLVAGLAVGTAAAVGNTWKAPPFSSIGINNVYFIGNQYGGEPADNDILRFWMETGSSTEACLTSIGEANHSPDVDTVYCSSRYVTLPGGHQRWGVMVTLHLEGPLVDVDGEPSWYSVNVYQEGAKFYGDPIRCDLEGC